MSSPIDKLKASIDADSPIATLGKIEQVCREYQLTQMLTDELNDSLGGASKLAEQFHALTQGNHNIIEALGAAMIVMHSLIHAIYEGDKDKLTPDMVADAVLDIMRTTTKGRDNE